MKIAVISDLHLGFKFGSERGEDAFRNAREAFERAIKEGVDLVLLPGDIFHNKVPKPEVMGRAIELFSILKRINSVKLINYKKEKDEESMNKKIPGAVVIYGTHERRNKGNVNPVHLLEKAGFLTHLHAESALIDVGGQRIGVHGLSGVPEQFAKSAMESWSPKPFPQVPNLLMIHQSFKELIPQVKKDIMSYMNLPKAFDLFLLGHIHWNVEDKHPSTGAPILVAGSTIRTQLRAIESKKDKGFYIIEIKNKKININFRKLENVRKFYFEEFDVDKKKPSEVITKIQEKTSELIKYHTPNLKPLIRFRLKGSLGEGFLPTDLNFGSLKKKFGDRALVYFDRAKVQSSKLSKRAELLYNLKQENVSVEEIGMKMLLENMEAETEEEVEKVREMFEKLIKGEIE